MSGQQRKAAKRDAREDGRTAGDLPRAGRVAEDDDTRYSAHERLEVEEGRRRLGGHPPLPIGE